MTALISIDLQYDFFDPSGHPNAGRLEKAVCLPAARKLLQHARNSKWQIIHVITSHSGKESLPPHLARRNARPYCLTNTDGAQIVEGLAEGNERIISKQAYDAFSNPAVAEEIVSHEQVVICGIAANCCVLFSAHSAANVHNKRVLLPFQAIAASKIEDYVYGLRIAEKSIANVVDLNDIISATNSESIASSLPCEDDQFEEIIRNWFKRQLQNVSRLREQSLELPVAEVVRRLEAMCDS